MPAAAVARRTPMIGGRAASAFGASGETGWDMRRKSGGGRGARSRGAPMPPCRAFAKLLTRTAARRGLTGETSTLGERPSIGAGRAADHAAPGAGLAGRGRSPAFPGAAYGAVGGLLADLDQLAVAADEVAIGGVGGDPVAVAPAIVAAVTPMAVAPIAAKLVSAAEPAAVMAAVEPAAMEALGRGRRRGERERADRRRESEGEGEGRGLDRLHGGLLWVPVPWIEPGWAVAR